jgi:hypothetical protein
MATSSHAPQMARPSKSSPPTLPDPPDVVTKPSDLVCVLQRAHKLLQAASPDYRHRGPTDGSDRLHWPAAIAAAKAHLEHAVRLLEQGTQWSALSAASRPGRVS